MKGAGAVLSAHLSVDAIADMRLISGTQYVLVIW